MHPKFVVADEPVSMLDASIRTGIIKLMMEERDRNGVAYLFITHDLSLAWLISDKIAIMYLGKIMELGTAEQIVKHALHPYSEALLAVMPVPGMEDTCHEENEHIRIEDLITDFRVYHRAILEIARGEETLIR